MEEEIRIQYQNTIYNLKEIIKKIENSEIELKKIKEILEDNYKINNEIINNSEISKIEENIKQTKTDIYNLISNISNKI